MGPIMLPRPLTQKVKMAWTSAILVCHCILFSEPLTGPRDIHIKPDGVISGGSTPHDQWQRPTKLIISWKVSSYNKICLQTALLYYKNVMKWTTLFWEARVKRKKCHEDWFDHYYPGTDTIPSSSRYIILWNPNSMVHKRGVLRLYHRERRDIVP